MTTVFFLFSLGSQIYTVSSPYVILKTIFPFKYLYEAERFLVVFYLFATMGIVLVLDKLFAKKKAILLAVLLLVFLERVSGSYYQTPLDSFTGKSYASVVAQIPSSASQAVLDLPLSEYGVLRGVEYNLLPFYYQKPIVQGYFHWFADTQKARELLDDQNIRQLFCSELAIDQPKLNGTAVIQTLRESETRIVVIHKDLLLTPGCEKVALLTEAFFQEGMTYEYPIEVGKSQTVTVKEIFNSDEVRILRLEDTDTEKDPELLKATST